MTNLYMYLCIVKRIVLVYVVSEIKQLITKKKKKKKKDDRHAHIW